MAKIARIPINNFHLGNDYTGLIYVGPDQKPMNVLLDTGSSALALDEKKYQPHLTTGDVSTDLAQTDAYGDGSYFTGAVITTELGIGDTADPVILKGGNAAIAYDASKNMFGASDGILGLAYAPLDDAFTMPANTWTAKYTEVQVRSGKHGTIEPYLTQLAGTGVISDKISFLTHRSVANVGSGGKNDPLNMGWMVVGGGEESRDLYTGTFQTVKVLSDDWYSTNLKAVIVGNQSPIAARIAPAKNMSSNSIIDSGTSSLDLSPQMLRAVISKFTTAQQELLHTAILDQKLVSTKALNLAEWPVVTFILEGDSGDVSLQVAPSAYWQFNAQEVGAAAAAITKGDPGLAILGLPLMNGYFTIFDGEADGGKGVVKFATKAA
jgi:Eukaryotic aspartyl protease